MVIFNSVWGRGKLDTPTSRSFHCWTLVSRKKLPFLSRSLTSNIESQHLTNIWHSLLANKYVEIDC